MNCNTNLYSKNYQEIPAVIISLSKVKEIDPLSDALKFSLSGRPDIIQITMIIYP